ncbi:MAG: EF-P lysine aminoacylase EpmA [Gammaproteobacteria bacterium]
MTSSNKIEPVDWRPTASLANLRLRAALLGKIRAFFALREVLEVETPALSHAGSTDRQLASFRVADAAGDLYLHTSPEFAMKRLVAAGYGDVWQLCKVFRTGEAGRNHNPEFTLLEWYRVGFDHRRLMVEVAELLAELLPECGAPPEYLTYREAFRSFAGIDPFTADIRACRAMLQAAGLTLPAAAAVERDGWLDLVAGELVYPRLGAAARLTFLHDYPADQAALARVRAGTPPVAERFEVFFHGRELANGYHELTDSVEQARRFAAERDYRRTNGLPDVPPDTRLVAALAEGLPDCAGVALGFDRVVMLAAHAAGISEAIAFPFARA